MKNFIFSAFCGIMLFVLLLATACSNVRKENVVSEEAVEYATDPLDVELTKIEKNDRNIFSIKGEEKIEETDEGYIRHCPVKLVNSETGAVKDTVFVFTENY